MKRFTDLSDNEKLTYFTEAGAQAMPRNRPRSIIEKDFWVTWILGRIYSIPDLAENIVFKGGTSLSKVHRAIERFSEDVDLSILPELIGYPEKELESRLKVAQTKSGNQRDKVLKELQKAYQSFVSGNLKKMLNDAITAELGNDDWLEYHPKKVNQNDYLEFKFRSVIPPEEYGYIKPSIKLEINSLTDQRPVSKHSIKPMVQEILPEIVSSGEVENCEVLVVALEVERTFWEKATILHLEHHRDKDIPLREHQARHYADLASLCRHEAKVVAMKSIGLLEQVAMHKARFFPQSWASYETARPGTLRLLPQKTRLEQLKKDYDDMSIMYYGDVLSIEEIIRELDRLEKHINSPLLRLWIWAKKIFMSFLHREG